MIKIILTVAEMLMITFAVATTINTSKAETMAVVPSKHKSRTERRK